MENKKNIGKSKKKVATKIMATFVIVVVVLAGVIGGATVIYDSLIDTLFSAIAASGMETYNMYITSIDELCSSIGAIVASEDVFQEALLANDAAAVEAGFSKVENNDVIDSVTFVDSMGRVLYSNKGRSAYGTDLSKITHIKDAMKGNKASSYVKDFEGCDIGYALAYPIKVEGRVVGVVSFVANISSNKLVDDLKDRTGNQYTIFNDDTRVATTLYDENRNRIVGTKASEAVLKEVRDEGNEYTSEVAITGVRYATCYIPIIDENETYLGMAFCGMNIDKYKSALALVKIICFGLTALFGIIGLCVGIKIISSSVTKALSTFTQLLGYMEVFDIENGVKNVAIDTKSQDEIGVMAAGLERMAGSLTRMCGEISNVLHKIADGDLTVKYDKSVFVGDMKEVDIALSKILVALNESMSKINISANEVASGAEEVSSGAQALSQGATEQASEIEQLSNIVKDITDKISQNARHATEANEIAGNTHNISIESKESMQNLSNAMLEINEVTLKMEKVVKTIDNFAFQTNILALNAAVEAARAGVHGRGFAVVAEEVRSLANGSAEAAKETGDLIESTVQIVESGVMLAQETSESFEKVVGLIDEVSEKVNSIADASNEQAMSASHIVTSIDEITKVIQTNSATAEESAAASEELSSLSHVFKEVVNKFKIDQSQSYGGGSSSRSYTPEEDYTPAPVESYSSNNDTESTYAAQSSSSVSYDSEDDKYF
ncbi:MAG: cache domain-containing protein [Oscillospiraceae bacterium]|nr:cache domain-containing protein [Oscillospiraceae bacterium]